MRQSARIVVVGSSNTDMVVRTSHLPRPGETVLGGVFAMMAGGKGANQAVAAARLGGQVTFIARLGNDVFGDNAVCGFDAEGIDTRFIVRDPEAPSGVALIGVDEGTGENSIIVASGANANLSVADIEAAREVIEGAAVVVCQLETPLATVAAALQIARAAGVTTLLNPAPALPLPSDLWRMVSVLTPNETEAAALTGKGGATPPQWVNALLELGTSAVVVTLGARGALVATNSQERLVQSFTPERIVDTTAAGDCFNGAIAVSLAEGHPLTAAVAFANAAASISVETSGAQPSLPRRPETDKRLAD